MIRVAGIGDLHFGVESSGRFRCCIEELPERADVLLLAGDLTKSGGLDEGKVVADELRDLGLPVVAVLGNHDYHADEEKAMADVLEDAGVVVLEGTGTVLEVNGARVGIAGTKGFGGGFSGACGSEFGEPEMKDFMRHTKSMANRLEEALTSMEADIKIALMHYSPIRDTLLGERLEIYPFLGSYLLAEAVDRAGADLVIHGHAHAGSEKGVTPGGIHVRNVAQPVVKHAYNLYTLEPASVGASR